MIDCYASQAHYADHLQPIWDALPDRGTWYAPRTEWTRGGGYTTTLPAWLGPTLVAGHADAMVVVKRGGTPILLEHGAGQTYISSADPGYRHPSNPGGDLREQIGMFLCTNEATARANRERYPSIPAVVVGSPRLDVLRDLRSQRDDPDEPVLGMTFHWNCNICPESRWAFPEWGEAMRHLDWPGEIVGSAHPRAWRNAERWYARVGIRAEPSWEAMVQQCDVVSADNTSCMFEAAALGIPVVVVNSARYRPEVEHGLRFWTWADIGPNVWPHHYESPEGRGAAWSNGCFLAERYADRMALRIADMAATVYPYQGEAAQRAADAVVRFVESA